jgi:hypothetical protein
MGNLAGRYFHAGPQPGAAGWSEALILFIAGTKAPVPGNARLEA